MTHHMTRQASMVVVWALRRSVCRDWNDHQPPGSTYVSDTYYFNHV